MARAASQLRRMIGAAEKERGVTFPAARCRQLTPLYTFDMAGEAGANRWTLFE